MAEFSRIAFLILFPFLSLKASATDSTEDVSSPSPRNLISGGIIYGAGAYNLEYERLSSPGLTLGGELVYHPGNHLGFGSESWGLRFITKKFSRKTLSGFFVGLAAGYILEINAVLDPGTTYLQTTNVRPRITGSANFLNAEILGGYRKLFLGRLALSLGLGGGYSQGLFDSSYFSNSTDNTILGPHLSLLMDLGWAF